MDLFGFGWIYIVFDGFIWIYMIWKGFQRFWGLDAGILCGSLWRPVEPCGSLWQPVAESCGPYILPCSVLGACRLAGWCLAGWLDGWMAGWLDGWMAGWKAGWMAGWLDGGHHSCNLARSSSRRVGGLEPD